MQQVVSLINHHFMADHHSFTYYYYDTAHITDFTVNLFRALHDRRMIPPTTTFINNVEQKEHQKQLINSSTTPRRRRRIKNNIAVIFFSKKNNYFLPSSRTYIPLHPPHHFLLPVFYDDVDPFHVLARLQEDHNNNTTLPHLANSSGCYFNHRNFKLRIPTPQKLLPLSWGKLCCGEFKTKASVTALAVVMRLRRPKKSLSCGYNCNCIPQFKTMNLASSSHASATDEKVISNERINLEDVTVVDSPVRVGIGGYDEVYSSNGSGDYTVGLEPRIQEVCSSMELRSNKVLMFGIYGMGGIGKTTLARAVYNRIALQYEGSCFLHNVGERSRKDGLVSLQNTFLSVTSGGKDIQLTNIDKGVSEIKLRLCQKKVLLILDDVDSLEQLTYLAGGLDCFGLGSRVIITTRDRHLLTLHWVQKTYQVEPLNDADAHDLLSHKAFKHGNVDPSYTNILNQAVRYASGLPLALEVIGSAMFGKSVDEWTHALAQFERIPDNEIQMILEVNFNDLQEDLKSVFLDIACCFKGYELAVLQEILFAHYGQRMEYHIQVLIEKSLISISTDMKVTLHPLLEDMAKKIVSRESPLDPGRRSRLWFPTDIIQVLTRNEGSSAVELIHLDLPLSEDEEVIEWDGDAFKKMKHLKTLIVGKYHFSKAPKHLPNSLKVLKWWKYPSHELPSDFNPNRLKIRELPDMGLVSPKQAELLEISQSVYEVSQTSQSISDVSQVTQSVPEVLQTWTRVVRLKLWILQRDLFQAERKWRLVGLVSSLVALSCQAWSPCFKRLIRGWNPFKFFLYGVLSLVMCATVLFAKPSSFSTQHKNYTCFVVFIIISVYSFLYDKAVDGKPEIRSLVSNVVSALVSLSLSKLVKFGFETGTFCYFLGCFTIQLLIIDWKLILVAIVVDCPLFLWHFSSDSQPEIDHTGHTIPLWAPNN